jgi:phosphate-selective porin OprO/OprP
MVCLATPAFGEGPPPDAPAESGSAPEPPGVVEASPPLTVRLRGRIETDAVMASQSVTSKSLLGDLQNGYGFRRLRLGAEGEIESRALYVAEIDFAGGQVRVRDAYIGLIALPWVSKVDVGYFREPFSIEGATSSRFLTFLERSPLNVLDPTRNWGIAGYWWPESERVTFALGAFRDGTNSGGFSGGDENTWSVTTRLTGLPLYEDDGERFRLIHLGGAFSQRSPAGGAVSFVPEPQSSLLAVPDDPASPFLPPVVIPSHSQQLYNLQAAWVHQSFCLSGEWFGTSIQQPQSGPVFFDGFYAALSWFATGEHRGYDRRRAAFDKVGVLRPVVRSGQFGVSGVGAVELTARFSLSDFRSSNLPPATLGNGLPAPGGGARLYESTFGVNWYLNDYTRLMANYTMAIPDVTGFSKVPVHAFGVRLALFF